jgi:predicted amidohydrolase
MPSTEQQSIRVAVVQLVARADPRAQLECAAERVAVAIRETRPELVILPEGLTSVRSRRAPWRIASEQGEALALILRLARCHGVWVAGGFVGHAAGHVVHDYVLAEPDGATHVHRKDAPDPWESGAVEGRPDDGFASTPLGPVGLAHGGEWLRARTAFRLGGRVRLVVGGSSWGGHGVDAVTARGTQHAPIHLARLVGAPVAHAALVVRHPSELAFGSSLIVDAQGATLSVLCEADGDAHACADVPLAPADLALPTPSPTGLIVPVPAKVRAAWRARTATRQRVGRRPAITLDGLPALMPYNPSDLPPEARPERQVIAAPQGVQPLPLPSAWATPS